MKALENKLVLKSNITIDNNWIYVCETLYHEVAVSLIPNKKE